MAAATVIFHRLALYEYQAAQRWYARRSAQAVQRFQDAVEWVVEQMAQAPDRWPGFCKQHRWVRVSRAQTLATWPWWFTGRSRPPDTARPACEG